jgi:hypothetical protein
MAKTVTEDLRERVKDDQGYFHLTPKGWIRADREPYPRERVETWEYKMEQPADDAKQRVRLTRVWYDSTQCDASRDALRDRFGDAVEPAPDRNVLLACRV